MGLARAVASSLAALLDFTYDRITDLHIGIDEACSRVMAVSEHPPGGRSHIELTFGIEDGGLRVVAMGEGPTKPGAVLLNVWSETILSSVADEVRTGSSDGRAFLEFFLAGGGAL